MSGRGIEGEPLNTSPAGDKSVADPTGTPARGMSNTPRPASFNTCIDYLKVRFDWMYMDGDKEFAELFRILMIDEQQRTVKAGKNGYEVMFVYDEGLVLQFGGEHTRNALGQNTTLLELQGHACRLFEERVCKSFPFETDDQMEIIATRNAWQRLLDKLTDMNAHCTRIDLPTDDMTGIIPFEELRNKIAEKEFTSNMRAFSIDDQLPKSVDTARVRKSKGAGYTATLGTRDTVQLCIYNKLAERMRHGGTLNVSFWIRYEVRYYHRNAERALAGLVHAYHENRENEFIVGCLSSCISFKEKRGEGRNTFREEIWDKWLTFIADVKAQQISIRTHTTATVESNAQWIMKEGSKILAVLCAIKRDKLQDVLYYLVRNGVDLLGPEELTKINNYCLAHDQNQFKDLGELYTYVMDAPGVNRPYDQDVVDMYWGDGVRLGSARYSSISGSENIDLSNSDPDVDSEEKK
jgi:DNA relaxase NicK